MLNWQDSITADPSVCHGKPCIKGTRIMVSVVVDNLAAGVPYDELLTSYPALDLNAIRAALAYAADLARARVVATPE